MSRQSRGRFDWQSERSHIAARKPAAPRWGVVTSGETLPEAKIVLSRPLYAKASGCMGCLAIDSCIQRAREAFDSIAARGDIIFEDVEQNKKVIVDPKKVSEDLAQMIGGFNDAKEQYTQLAQVCRDSDTGKIDLYDEGAVVGYICGATQEEYKITPTES